MSDEQIKYTRSERKELDKMYDPENEFTLREIMEEVRPIQWHHSYSWSPFKQNIMGMLPMIVLMLGVIYWVVPQIPKPDWALPVISVLIVTFFILFFLLIFVQAKLASAHFYLSCCFYMGGRPDCGIQQLQAYYPVAEPETPKELEKLDIDKLRTYLRALSQRLAENIEKQRKLLQESGVELPIPKTQIDSVQQFFNKEDLKQESFRYRILNLIKRGYKTIFRKW